jgi:outer membrane protein OmpA-like peptidoglycan-associated protein
VIRIARLPLLAALASAALAAPSWAQTTPSVDQIIRSLTPTGDVTKAGTRGIRLSAPAEVKGGDGKGIPVAAQGQAQPAAPTINLTVNFATASAELTPQAVDALDKLGQALASPALAGYRFRIEGHTDTVGTKDYNRGLSDRRGQTVVAYIQDKYKVDGARLQAVGMGADHPLVRTADQVDEPRNRRVQVTNIEG